MLIIGDAAHAVAPSSGQGVSMAAEDAVTLAVELHKAPDVVTGLKNFVEVRRPRCMQVRDSARSLLRRICHHVAYVRMCV